MGSEFYGFEILAQIGQGAFGRVFLARQRELSERLVVLKLSTEATGEAHTLAQLLHSNIVPIYSFHRMGSLYAVCMPFLGTITLADVIREVRYQGLPDSGKYLVRTLKEHRSARLSCRSHSSGSPISKQAQYRSGVLSPAPETSPLGSLFPGEPSSQVILEKLAGLSYVDSVLWLVCQLADGLGHAHEHGIIHRDLKPANILLTDEGQPLLLDFNLAEDTKRSALEGARLGGTLPYMSPEQLQALAGGKSPADSRSDLYSLGVILFELLTGRFPFPAYSGWNRKVLDRMMQDRGQAPLRLQPLNKEITPAVEAMVRRCLEPDPNCRYQSARELQEDLERHREHLPLLHAREPSWKERALKWSRRHPRLTSFTSVASLALGIIATLILVLAAASGRLQAFEAAQHYQHFQENLAELHFLLATQSADQQEVEKFLQQGQEALAHYQVADDPGWRKRPEVQNLVPEKQQELQGEVQGLLLMLARARAIQAAGLPPGPRREAEIRLALSLNDQAGREGADDHLPRALWTQRALLLALLDEKKEAEKFQAQAGRIVPKNSKDAYLAARELANLGRFREAIPFLENATRQEPQNVPAWFLLGRCHDCLTQDKDALACYTICLALRPQAAQAHFFRGLVHFRLGDFRPARDDFSQVITLDPKNPDPYLNRALAWHGLGQHQKAIADMTRGLELKAPYTRVFFMRSRLLEKTGDKEGARKDREEGLKRQPNDELSWTARGVARLGNDLPGALADFRNALKINPRSLPALVNSAHVLAQMPDKMPEAIPLLDQTIALFPDYLPARTGRGRLLARLGKRGPALQDGAEVLKRSSEPALLFQVAGIYALTSRHEAKDRQEALRLLTAALRKGYGFELLEREADLGPLRNSPEFARLLKAVQVLR